MKVLACIISWNSADHLGGALESLIAQTHRDTEIVVIDNASIDDSRVIAGRYEGVRVVENSTNRGFAGAANQGIELARRAGAEAFLVCNPDVRLEPRYIEFAAAALVEDEGRAAVQGKLWRLTDNSDPLANAGSRHTPAAEVIDTTGHLAFRTRLFRNRGEGEPDLGQFDAPGEVFGVSGAVAMYRLASLTDVACDGEVFDEDLFAYWEDIDLDWRLQLRGWKVWYEPAARGWHERGGAGPRRSALVERLNFTNRFLVVMKNDDPRALFAALPGFVVTSVLKAAELLLTVPTAFARSLPRLALIPRMMRKRRLAGDAATVERADVVARWFGRFSYRAWVRTWWRRVHRDPRRP